MQGYESCLYVQYAYTYDYTYNHANHSLCRWCVVEALLFGALCLELFLGL